MNIYRRSSLPASPELIARVPIRPDGQGVPLIGRGRQRVTMNDFEFVDDDVSPGTTYYYSASAVNARGGEGPRSAEISLMPMALDKRGIVLFHTRHGLDYLVNYDSLLSFYGRWAERCAFDTLSIDLRHPPVADPAHFSRYQCIVLVSEDQRGDLIESDLTRSLKRALHAGSKFVFVIRNHPTSNLGMPRWDTPMSSMNSVLEDLFGVRLVIPEGVSYYRFDSTDPLRQALISRFIGAKSSDRLYPDIDADSLAGMSHKYIELLLDYVAGTTFLAGYVPGVGAIYDLAPETEVIYRYNSAYDTSIYEGQPVAIRRITDSTAAVYFGFPLSQMKHEQAWQALTQAVADLGVDTVDYWLPPTSTTRGIIGWLYGHSTGNPDVDWDVNHDGVIDIRDVVEELDR